MKSRINSELSLFEQLQNSPRVASCEVFVLPQLKILKVHQSSVTAALKVISINVSRHLNACTKSQGDIVRPVKMTDAESDRSYLGVL
jgi:hypothetical protein